MPKCPKYGKEIDYLKDYSKCEEVYDFRVSETGHPQYDMVDTIPGSDYDDYECPECGEVLFTGEGDALKFLKGE